MVTKSKKNEYVISGVLITEINPFNREKNYGDTLTGFLDDEDPNTEVKYWNNNGNMWISNKKGVYIIYSETGFPLYVGQTGGGKATFYSRFPRESNLLFFRTFARYVKFYYINDVTSRLLFERIKIHQLKPLLNRDRGHLIISRDYSQEDMKTEVGVILDLAQLFNNDFKEIAQIINDKGFTFLLEWVLSILEYVLYTEMKMSESDIDNLIRGEDRYVTKKGLIDAYDILYEKNELRNGRGIELLHNKQEDQFVLY